LVLIDLAVPRNVDPSVNDLGGVFRFDVDDLAQIAGQGKERRLVAAEQAERIVQEASSRFWRNLMGVAVNDRIGGIVRQAEEIRRAELARVTAASTLGEQQQAAVDAMTRAIVKKVLHGPLSHLRALAEAGDTEATVALLKAFNEVSGESEDG